MTLYEQFCNGSVIALSRLISHIEDLGEGYQALLARLYRRSKGIYRIGLTGPPGAGKSSLVNRLAGLLLDRKYKVAIICVDPSSPFTGGALLGDRLRMQDIPLDKGVYIRSMGSRGSGGGLAAATSNVAVALDAFGFDTLIIETIGVGQMELDIVDACDTVVVTLVPESGDAIQALKAGLMEIADIIAVNKADRPGAEQMVYDLNSALEMRTQKSEWAIPVLTTQAVNNKNVAALMEKVESHRAYLSDSGRLADLRRQQVQRKIETLLTQMIRRDMRTSFITDDLLQEIVGRIIKGEDDPYSASMALYERFKIVS